jgi:hypothetical protein
MADLIFLSIVAVLVVIAIAFIRVVPERQRYAIFQEGNFVAFKGPGLLFKMPGGPQQWLRVGVGDKADIIGLHLASINGANIPIELEEGEASGVGFRVTGFRGNKVLVGSDTGSG